LLSRRLELTPLTTNAARPRILAQCIDHRTANPALGEGLELDASRFIEPVRCVD